ncbi:hypothetical protein K3729_17195 [Rhodobacteraceae bacterium S2214]|nr:hypothetical protein K3729_17195 [Rhodobacteraceae bacterium S2214]
MGRIHTDPSPTALAQSGILRDALVAHSKARMRFFFLYMYSYRMLMHVLQIPSDQWPQYVSIKATHQFNTGARRDSDWDLSFQKDDVGILDHSASSFRRIDAAHFCNLGLAPSLATLCARSGDPRAVAIYETLTMISAATRFMPQRINIGPDRVVDTAHGVLCREMLKNMANGAAAISPSAFARYKSYVSGKMTAYADSQTQQENFAVAEATLIYVATWGETVAPTELRQNGNAKKVINTRETHFAEIWSSVSRGAHQDFVAYGFDRDDGASLSMILSNMVS